jgi:2-dehydropantoate 2-reductase
MQIAVVGAGGIGSTFAVQLARAGHEVTVVARRTRLEQLSRDGGVATPEGAVAMKVAKELPLDVAYDLVLVTVLAHQVDALLPALRGGKARHVMFMFNTFAALDALRDAVGAERFAFGFPSILAQIDAGGVLRTSIQDRGLLTTVTDARWARVFSDAGIPATTTPDMPSWLRSHAAAVVPFMIAAAAAHRDQHGISWAFARDLAAAMREGFGLVRALGQEIIPAPHAFAGHLPAPAAAAMLWAMSRSAAIQKSGAAGDAEPRALIDAMLAAAGRPLPALEHVRPV